MRVWTRKAYLTVYATHIDKKPSRQPNINRDNNVNGLTLRNKVMNAMVVF